MSDFANAMENMRGFETFVAQTGACNAAVNCSITTGSTAATLASTPGSLRNGNKYSIVATGIPAATTFQYKGSTAIVLSAAATATNATAASTITPAKASGP